MSCDFCENEHTLLSRGFYTDSSFFWKSDNINLAEHSETNYGVLIDRGYLRLCDTEDTNCLDHGEKIKINYCPMCGDKIK